MALYDNVVITYNDGMVKKYTFNISTYEGVEKRDNLLDKARRNKKVDRVEIK